MFQLLTFTGVVIGILIILYRWGVTIGAAVKTVYDPNIPAYRKVVFGGYGFWGKFLRAVMDTSFTFIGMATFRVVIAGTSSAPIGAICGLLFSFSVTGLPYYTEYAKRQVRSRRA